MSLLWRIVLFGLLLINSLPPYRVVASEPARPIRIGVLNSSWGPTPADAGLREGLQELGYHENEDFVIGVRFTQGDLDVLPVVAQELVQHGVDLVFTADASPAKAAQRATTQVPIVFTSVHNPVQLGLIQSFARPGGNIIGVTELHVELGPKRLEVFQEIIPDLRRILFPYDPTDAQAVAGVQRYRSAARRLGIKLVEQTVSTEEEAQAVLTQIHNDEIGGILAPFSPSLNLPGFILETASQRGIPTMFGHPFMVEHGGLASYGPDLHESGRQAARLVDKIIKGKDPAQIPVEVNSKIMFTINLDVAKALGLTIAPEVLYRADLLIR